MNIRSSFIAESNFTASCSATPSTFNLMVDMSIYAPPCFLFLVTLLFAIVQFDVFPEVSCVLSVEGRPFFVSLRPPSLVRTASIGHWSNNAEDDGGNTDGAEDDDDGDAEDDEEGDTGEPPLPTLGVERF
jgi:hypothetical protein